MTLFFQTDGDFSGAMLAAEVPVPDSASAFALFGGTRADSLRNLADPDNTFSAVGTPTIGANYVELSTLNYLDTRVADDSHSFTMLWASRLPAALSGGGLFARPVGSGDGGSTSGFIVLYEPVTASAPAGDVQTQIRTTGGVVGAKWGQNNGGQTRPDQTTWTLMGLRWTAGSGARLYNFSKGTSTALYDFAGSANARVLDPRGILIGTRRGASGDGTSDRVQMAAWSYHKAALADADVTAVAAFMRAQLAARGVPV